MRSSTERIGAFMYAGHVVSKGYEGKKKEVGKKKKERIKKENKEGKKKEMNRKRT